MRSTKVFSMLFGLAQLILFIKLIEIIQGADADAGIRGTAAIAFRPLEVSERKDGGRTAAAFRASKTTAAPKVSSVIEESSAQTTAVQAREQGESRNCPVCSGSECEGSVTTHKYTVPLIPLKLGALAIAFWLALFFKLWKFPKHSPETQQHSGYPAAVSGYGHSGGGGYPSSGGYGGYPSPVDTGYAGGTDSGSGVFDTVMRAIEKFAQ